MLNKINTAAFLKFIKKTHPNFYSMFSNSIFLEQVINVFYSQELLINALNNNINSLIQDSEHEHNYLLIPINVDNL
jgi:hypothetical protein|tara:strand:- start:197 stop:424 length:228 start_codon:yes stop_codon:yes gene_type:complete